jgi:cell division protein FtsI (penicillin-binding protein 3)
MKGRPPAGRLVGLFVILALAFVGVATRLVVLQVRDAEVYHALAREQRIRSVTLPATRGSILDRDGHELALSLPARAVFADPRYVEDPSATAESLARFLDVRVAELEAALTTDSAFVYLARRVDLDVARRIEGLELPGIGFLEESKRYYPGEDLAAQLLGFVGVDGIGLEGLELRYDDLLRGQPGSMVIEQDPSGNQIPQGEGQYRPPVPGTDLVLTIDRDLQFQAQATLEQAVKQNGARGGTVIVIDPSTGEILVMATYPTFDANAFQLAPPGAMKARAVTDIYEPGSVNKVITAAAALEEGVIGLREVLSVPDHYQVSDHLFHDAHPHPPMPMTLTDVIAQSSNIGTIKIAERLGAELLDGYLRRFGFGVSTGVGFPGEETGILMPAEDWWGTSMGTIPIGQGIAVTPLQMASVYATLANDGVRVEPTLMKGTIDGRGSFRPSEPADEVRVVSARTARLVRGMLAHAVMDGTGTEAQVPGYWVAGKTGTARKPLEGALGYSNEYVASFIGLFPASDPELVVAAILDEPDTVYGGIAAAPLFRTVAEACVRHLRIPPARPPAIPPLAADARR